MLFKSIYNTKQNKNTTKIKRADNPAILKAAHTKENESIMDKARLGFEKRNKDIEDEMKRLAGRIELKEGEREDSYAMREELMEKEKQLKNFLNNWKAWELIQNKEGTIVEQDKKESEIITRMLKKEVEKYCLTKPKNEGKNQEAMITEKEDYTNEDLYGDNGISDHNKGLYEPQREGSKSYLCALCFDASRKHKKCKQKNDQITI